MKRLVLWFLAAAVICMPRPGFAYVFLDDFNDGDLSGWTAMQGDWSNTGSAMQSSYDNYGVIWKDDSSGMSQYLEADAYFGPDSQFTKSAQLRLRSGMDSGSNKYFDHGYFVSIQRTNVSIYNAVRRGYQAFIGQASIFLTPESWHTFGFSVEGTGNDTNLKLWVDNQLILDVFDLSGYQHDEGGYMGLGSSNHINRRVMYDNVSGLVDEVTPVPEPASMALLGIGLLGLIGIKKKAN